MGPTTSALDLTLGNGTNGIGASTGKLLHHSFQYLDRPEAIRFQDSMPTNGAKPHENMLG